MIRDSLFLLLLLALLMMPVTVMAAKYDWQIKAGHYVILKKDGSTLTVGPGVVTWHQNCKVRQFRGMLIKRTDGFVWLKLARGGQMSFGPPVAIMRGAPEPAACTSFGAQEGLIARPLAQ